MKKSKNKKRLFKHISFIIACIVLVVGIGLIILFKTHLINHNNKSAVTTGSSIIQPISHASSDSTTIAQGGAVDKQGNTTATTQTTEPSQWTVSTSKQITLQQPINGATLKSGDTIRGIADVNTVDYRLSDDSVGVISQGTLNVINSKFSGILQFQAHAATGELQIFSTNPQSGAEINHADINIKFSQYSNVP